MAKDPAFLFYSQDFYTGVATLNWEDRGKFISILCLMHQQGRMKEETIRFLVGSISDNLKAKFRIDEKGFWYNERLEIEAEKRNNFTESRRINGNLGGRPKKQKPSGKPTKNLVRKHTVNRMEDENENVIENKNTNENEFEKKFENAFDDLTLETYKMTFRERDIKKELQEFLTKCNSAKEDYHQRDISGLRLAFQYQLKNSKSSINGSINRKQQADNDITASVAEYYRKKSQQQ